MAQPLGQSDASVPFNREIKLGNARIFGAWTWDGDGECFTFDTGTAETLLGNARLAGKPILKELACIQIEPDDSRRFLSTLRQVDGEGPLRMEIRVDSSSGQRNLEFNGWLSREVSGRVMGAGVILDPAARGQTPSSEVRTMAQLAYAAKLCSQARDGADDLGDEAHSRLIDQILSKLGQALSREPKLNSLDS